VTERLLHGIFHGLCWAGAMMLGNWYHGDPLWSDVALVGVIAASSWMDGRGKAAK